MSNLNSTSLPVPGRSKPRNLAQAVVEHITESIRNDSLKTGEKLPTESEIDLAELLVARLPAAVAGRITSVPGDLRTFSVPGRFPLVIAAFNVVEHLYTRVELAACLARVAAHLAPGGAFAFDVQLPDGSGVDAASALRDACPFGEVVLITGFATVDIALAALRAGKDLVMGCRLPAGGGRVLPMHNRGPV